MKDFKNRKNLIDSMSRRVQAVIKVEGGQYFLLTHYYPSQIQAEQHQTNYWFTVQMKKNLRGFFLFAIPIVYAKLFKQINKNFTITKN